MFPTSICRAARRCMNDGGRDFESRSIAPRATGGGLAAPVWGDFMRRVYYADAPDDGPGEADGGSDAPLPLLPIPHPWPILEGLLVRRVDSRTGLLASRWCPSDEAYDELYLPGTEPTDDCDREGPRRNP